VTCDHDKDKDCTPVACDHDKTPPPTCDHDHDKCEPEVCARDDHGDKDCKPVTCGHGHDKHPKAVACDHDKDHQPRRCLDVRTLDTLFACDEVGHTLMFC
jgi:hypothetical protein